MYANLVKGVLKTTRPGVDEHLFAPDHGCDLNVCAKINTYWIKCR